jgi:four helix bundle protein
MAMIERFEDIQAWQMAREITREIYEMTSTGKFSQDYILRDQIRRAVVSISSNIAEGFERDGNKELVNFLSIAKGSCGEVRSQLYLASDQSYLSDEKFREMSEKLIKISRAIAGFMKYLRQSEMRGTKFIVAKTL